MPYKVTANGLVELVKKAKAAGQTQTDISTTAGIHTTALSTILSGKREPSRNEMVALCVVFNKTFDDLFEIVLSE